MTRKTNSFNQNHIFVDTRSAQRDALLAKNVLVGGYSGDARYQKDGDCLHYLYSLTGKRLYISSLSIAQLVSVYQKKKSNEEIKNVVRDLQHRFNVIRSTLVACQSKNFTTKDINAALVETGADIEDNIQYVLAQKQKCSIIITNNYKDYRSLQNIRAVRPERVRAIPR